MLIPESREYPPVEMMFRSANRNCNIQKMLNPEKKSISGVAYTLLIVLAAVNAILTLAVAL